MAVFYNPRIIRNGSTSFYLPIPLMQLDARHTWKGKYHSIPLGQDRFTGRVKGPIDITLSGIICIDYNYDRLTEPELWNWLFSLEDALSGGAWGDFELVINKTSPMIVYQNCYTRSFSYSKPETKIQFIPWSAKITCTYPTVLTST